MKIFKNIIFFMLVISISFFSYAQEDLSLSGAINRALENNYDIRIVKLDEKISEINNSWGAAGRYPTLGFDISSNNQSNFNLNRDYTSSSGSMSLTLNWILFDGFSIKIRKQKLDYYSELSKGFTAVLVENTIQSIIKAYYTAILEKEKLAVRKELMDLSRDRYDHALTQQEIGTAVTYEVLQAKNAWLEDKSDHMLQQSVYKNSLRDLNYLMGITEDKEFILTDEFDPLMEDYNIESLINKMLKDNKTLKNQYVSQKLLERDIALAKSNYYPTLSLRSGASMSESRTKYEDDEISKSKTRNLFANLTLSFSLFEGGARKRAVDIARVEEEIGQIGINEMKHSLTIQLKNYYEFYNVREELYNVAIENLEAAKLNMEISEEKFRSGTINSFNYRDVQLIYLNSSINRLNAIYNLIDSHTSLMRITGGIITEYSN